MLVKGIIDEDFANYKRPSLFIAFPSCTFKCQKESGVDCCQNSDLAHSPNIEISAPALVSRYLQNPITSAIVFGGLEPFDSWDDMLELVAEIRDKTSAEIVVYSGYNKAEIEDKTNVLRRYSNIIVKFGRFIPNQGEHYDEVLGVNLHSDNQYAERLEAITDTY